MAQQQGNSLQSAAGMSGYEETATHRSSCCIMMCLVIGIVSSSNIVHGSGQLVVSGHECEVGESTSLRLDSSVWIEAAVSVPARSLWRASA